MRTLTKHNTALDLSKLTEGEKVELCSLINNTSFIRDYPEAWIMYFDKELKFYRTCWDGYIGIKGKEIVDLKTFKSIHFPEQEDKHTYEELVEALRESTSVLRWMLDNTTPDSDWETFHNSGMNAITEGEQLLERINK